MTVSILTATTIYAKPDPAKFREELVSISESYMTRYPYDAFSALRGYEGPLTWALSNDAGPILSLASGSDILRPLAAYPWSGAYHLVDILSWGDSPDYFIQSVQRRLEHLPQAKVQLIDVGFKEQFDHDLFFATRSPETKDKIIARINEGDLRPMVWKVDWFSAEFGARSDFFYLHVANFLSLTSIQSVVKIATSKSPLRGVLESGWTSLPPNDVMHFLWENGQSEMPYVFEFCLSDPVDQNLDAAITWYKMDIAFPTSEFQLRFSDSRIESSFLSSGLPYVSEAVITKLNKSDEDCSLQF